MMFIVFGLQKCNLFIVKCEEHISIIEYYFYKISNGNIKYVTQTLLIL